MNYFTFAGRNSNEFGLRVFYGSVDNATGEDYERISIPGRDGDLLMSRNRHENVPHVYSVVIVDDYQTRIRQLRDFLLSAKGYQRLEDNFNPDEFYMACFHPDEIEFTADMYRKKGYIELEFDRKPQRYLMSGETTQTFTGAGTITNPTPYSSRPLIRAYGTGTFIIGGRMVQITAGNAYTDIDSDMQDAYYGAQNCNDNVKLQDNLFPVLNPGVNNISIASGITRLEIKPRWYRL